MSNAMSSSPDTMDEKDGISPDVARAVWPVLGKLGEVQNFDSPDDFMEDAKSRNMNRKYTNYDLIEVQAYHNRWGLVSLWLYIDAKKRIIQIMGTESLDGDLSPEEIQEAMARLINFREDMLKAGYVLSEKPSIDSGNYDMKFEKPVDTEDPQKVYAAVDDFISIL